MYVDDVMNLMGGLDWLGINYYKVKCFIVFIVLMFFLLIMCILVNFD